jgi:hypothetical protein
MTGRLCAGLWLLAVRHLELRGCDERASRSVHRLSPTALFNPQRPPVGIDAKALSYPKCVIRDIVSPWPVTHARTRGRFSHQNLNIIEALYNSCNLSGLHAIDRDQEGKNVSRGARHSRDWQDRDRVDRINAGERRHAERVQALLSARRSAVEAPARMLRPGISLPTAVRYASTSAPLDWALADRGRAIIDAILDSVEDGNDRVILAWPTRPGTGFVAAALTLREARASGRLADATLALWPWRNGATWSARSILVHPEDIAQMGARAADEIMHGAGWNKQGLAQGSLNLLEMRLRDLVTSKTLEASARADGHRDNIVVRSPTLLETTAVFAPSEAAKSPPYVCDEGQVLRRVRDHTQIGEKKGGLKVNVPAIGDPTRTPFAIFGLPSMPTPEALYRHLDFSRFKSRPLDAVIVDVTRTGRSELSDDWERYLSIVLQAFARVPDRRPVNAGANMHRRPE